MMNGHHGIGGAVLLTAGIASVGFEGAFHFLLSNPENVAQVTDHHRSFEVTTILTTMGALLLVVAALVAGSDTSVTASERSRL